VSAEPTDHVTRPTKPGRPAHHLASRWPWAARALGAGAVLAVSTALASNGVSALEEDVFERIHDVPRWVDFAVWAPMQLGGAWAPAIAAFVGWRLTRSWRPTVGALVAGWGGWWLAKGVKDLVDRGRPAAELSPEVVRPPAVTEGLGFVSGHSTVAFACAAILSPYLPRRWRVVAYGLATVVGVSRIVVGAHLPLDVVGGAALGLLLAWLWHAAVGVEVADGE
jgi:glycosyltransferase 2 family protein